MRASPLSKIQKQAREARACQTRYHYIRICIGRKLIIEANSVVLFSIIWLLHTVTISRTELDLNRNQNYEELCAFQRKFGHASQRFYNRQITPYRIW
jgi:hypothetical protein